MNDGDPAACPQAQQAQQNWLSLLARTATASSAAWLQHAGMEKGKPRPEVGSVRVITKGSALGGYRQGSKARPGRWRCCAAGSIMRCGGLAAKVPRVARRHGSWSGAEHTAGRRNDGPVRLPPSISRAARHTNKDVARLLNMGLPLVQSARKTLPVICSTGKKLADAFNAPVQDLPLQAIGRVVQIASGVITMKTILSALERPVVLVAISASASALDAKTFWGAHLFG